jgi:hypothetical protein
MDFEQQVKAMKAVKKRLLEASEDVDKDIQLLSEAIQQKKVQKQMLESEIQAVKSQVNLLKQFKKHEERDSDQEINEEKEGQEKEEQEGEEQEKEEQEGEEQEKEEHQELGQDHEEEDALAGQEAEERNDEDEIIHKNVPTQDVISLIDGEEGVIEKVAIPEPTPRERRRRPKCPCGFVLHYEGTLKEKGLCYSSSCIKKDGLPRRCSIPLYYYECVSEECVLTICQSCYKSFD